MPAIIPNMPATFSYKREYLSTIDTKLLLKAYLSLNKQREILTKVELVKALSSLQLSEEQSKKIGQIISKNEVRVNKYSYQPNRSVMINPPKSKMIYGRIIGNVPHDPDLCKVTITQIIDDSGRESVDVISSGLTIFCHRQDLTPIL